MGTVRLVDGGGLVSANMPLLFEVRFAYELTLASTSAEYECAAGVGDPTADFRIHGERDWVVELMSIRESNALKGATHQFGPIYQCPQP